MERVAVEKKVLSVNDQVAGLLRERFRASGTAVINCISSPGSGKTLLLERTLERMPPGRRVAVVTGDIQTDNDARRLSHYGYPVRQITTAGACHLDARMVEKSIEGWDLDALDLLVVENVGNLVCPTSYDLGEMCKVVVLSVTEGDDKPLKYPGAFFRSRLMVLNKIDLLPYVPFSVEAAIGNARRINPAIEILQISCTSGTGLEAWMEWLEQRMGPPLSLS